MNRKLSRFPQDWILSEGLLMYYFERQCFSVCVCVLASDRVRK